MHLAPSDTLPSQISYTRKQDNIQKAYCFDLSLREKGGEEGGEGGSISLWIYKNNRQIYL